jgi:sigma-B regulation protein RsbU (phosphoserine phosphatase)
MGRRASDHNMPSFSSTKALAVLRASGQDIPFIIVSGSIGGDVAVAAMKSGAHDYIMKGNRARLIPAITRDLGDAAQRRRRQEAEHALLAQAEQMRIARQIQQRLFPQQAPCLPGFDLAGASWPAEATGGDYYDFFPMAGETLAIVVGDVTGHGVGSALLMADTRAYLRSLALSGGSPDAILARASRLLQDDLGEDHFVTLFFARLDPFTRRLDCLNAGHPPAWVLDRAGNVRHRLVPRVAALGLMPGTEFPPPDTVTLEPGELVVILTDGILEAASADGTEFGPDRVLDAVRQTRTEPARAVVDALACAALRHGGDRPQSDDLTAVVLKATGS